MPRRGWGGPAALCGTCPALEPAAALSASGLCFWLYFRKVLATFKNLLHFYVFIMFLSPSRTFAQKQHGGNAHSLLLESAEGQEAREPWPCSGRLLHWVARVGLGTGPRGQDSLCGCTWPQCTGLVRALLGLALVTVDRPCPCLVPSVHLGVANLILHLIHLTCPKLVLAISKNPKLL